MDKTRPPPENASFFHSQKTANASGLPRGFFHTQPSGTGYAGERTCMMNKIVELRNKRNTLWEQTKHYLEDHRNEKGLVSAADLEQYDRMTADVMAMGEEIKRLEAQMELDAQLSAPTTNPVHLTPGAQNKKTEDPRATEEYSDAFWNFMRGNNSIEVRNALSVGVGEEGGYTVPDEFERRLIEALRENNIFRSLAHVMRTNSGVRTIPIAGDIGTAAWVEEGAAIPESDMKFSTQTLSAYKMGSEVKISNELLHDSAFDMASYVAENLGRRFGNLEEDAFINGTGASQNPAVASSMPTGILTTLGTPAVKSASSVEISFDDVFKLYYALRAPYRRKAVFLCNETVLLQLMLLKDKNGNYLWKPSLDIAKPDTILGHPIYTSTYMPAIEGDATNDADKKVLLFGDLSYYWVADRGARTLKRLNELYAKNDQVAFIGTQRVDGKLILPEAVQCMGMGAKANG